MPYETLNNSERTLLNLTPDELATISTKTGLAWALEGCLTGEDLKENLRDRLNEQITALRNGGDIDSRTLREVGGDTLVERALSITESEQALRAHYDAPEQLVHINGTVECHIAEGTPREPKNTLILAPGSFTGPKQVEHFAIASAQKSGRIAVPEMFTPQEFRAQEASHEERRMTDIVRAYSTAVEASILHETKDGGKVDLMGYSIGAAAMVDIALRHSEKVQTVVLVNPVGTTHLDRPYLVRLKKLLEGAAAHSSHITSEKLMDDPRYKVFADWMPRQKTRGYTELLELLHTAAKIDITPLLKQLTDKGITVQIVLSEDDKLFEISNAEANLADVANIGSTEYREQSGSCNVVQLKGGHTLIGADPEALAEIIHDLR